MSGYLARMSAETVPLPAAVGPASTVRRPGAGVSSVRLAGAGSAKLLDQLGDLVRAEATHPARLGDPDLGHDLLRGDTADARQRLQQREHLELADRVVGLALLDYLGELASGVLEPVLHLGTGRTRGSGLLERCGSLLGREVGKGHGLTSGRKGLACNLATRPRRGNRGGASPPRSRVRVEIEGLDPRSRRRISISRGG